MCHIKGWGQTSPKMAVGYIQTKDKGQYTYFSSQKFSSKSRCSAKDQQERLSTSLGPEETLVASAVLVYRMQKLYMQSETEKKNARGAVGEPQVAYRRLDEAHVPRCTKLSSVVTQSTNPSSTNSVACHLWHEASSSVPWLVSSPQALDSLIFQLNPSHCGQPYYKPQFCTTQKSS